MLHCPTCAAALRFDINRQMMYCEHCANSFKVSNINDNQKDDAKGTDFLDTYIFLCPSCGAELATNDQNDAVGFCPYCGGASMLYDRVRKDWKPDYIIPFRVTKEQCKKNYVKEVKRHLFVSRKLCKPELIESFRGIYMPYWKFEGEQKGEYLVKNLVDTKTSSKKIVATTYNQHFTTDRKFSGISHDASLNFDDHLSEKLEPYKEVDKVPFHPGYTCGFYAEIADADEQEYEEIIKSEITRISNEDLIEKHKGKIDNLSIPTKVEIVEHDLRPVWFMSYRRKKKITYATVNGQTGKVAADLPLSPLRIIVAVLLAAALLFGLIFSVMSVMPSIKANATLGICACVMYTGLLYLLESFISTVSQSLQLSSYKKRGAYYYVLGGVLAFLLIIGVVMISTDGSYSQSRAFFGFILAAPSAVYFLIQTIKMWISSSIVWKGLKNNTESQLRNGIIVATRIYRGIFIALFILAYISLIICAFFTIGDFAPKFVDYALCCLMAFEMLIIAFVSVMFQTQIAKRRPPQMNKKGALYDEN